jgi:hypothetical protein
MRSTVTSRLVDKVNKAKGLKYPSIGYLLFQDIKGDGWSKPALYETINAGGGVSYSSLNGPPRVRCKNLRRVLLDARRNQLRFYRGVTISRIWHSGMWCARSGGLMADTLGGLKQLIRENLK